LSAIKKLASQTAIYGLSSIVGRFINYLLVLLHTRVLTDQADFGVVGEIYAYVTFINIIYLFGMETAYFRFSSKNPAERSEYYSSSSTAILVVSIFFSGLLIALAPYLNNLLITDAQAQSYYKVEYIIWFALIMGFDAITAIPFARLRQENRPIKFVSIKIFNILVNVFLNLFFLWFCPFWIERHPESWLTAIYDPSNNVAYIFISNLVASGLTILFLYRELIGIQIKIKWAILKPMLVYGFPLLFAGLAGMMNETFGRIMLKYLLPGSAEENLAQLGIYNAAYKLSIFMTLAIQAFRMAAEPFFFSLSKQEESRLIYARVMTYFIIVCAVIFLGVSLNLNIAGLYIGENYREGLFVVPSLLMANLFLGVYYNLSIWYKLADKTIYSIYFTIFGALVTVIFNILWIPTFGYEGSSWATLVCYILMAFVCYLIGQRYYKVPYNMIKFVGYLIFALILYTVGYYMRLHLYNPNTYLGFLYTNLLIVIFIAVAYLIERKTFKPKHVENSNHQ